MIDGNAHVRCLLVSGRRQGPFPGAIAAARCGCMIYHVNRSGYSRGIERIAIECTKCWVGMVTSEDIEVEVVSEARSEGAESSGRGEWSVFGWSPHGIDKGILTFEDLLKLLNGLISGPGL